jgi:carbon storage regulator
MLHLDRREEESIIIGDDIEVVVLSIEGTKVKLGIRAPRSKEVLRGELCEKFRRWRRDDGADRSV